MFYNTTNLQGEDLFSSHKRTNKQEVEILSVFKMSRQDLTPFEVQETLMLRGFDYPITSIRRAITDLTEKGLLVKTKNKKMGAYGQKNYTWELNNV